MSVSNEVFFFFNLIFQKARRLWIQLCDEFIFWIFWMIAFVSLFSNFMLSTILRIIAHQLLRDLFLENFDKISNDDSWNYACFIIWQSIVLCFCCCVLHIEKRHEIVFCVKFFMIFIFQCTFRVLFSDCLLWNSYKVNSYQVLLNWDDNLSCNIWRNVCLQFFDSYLHV